MAKSENQPFGVECRVAEAIAREAGHRMLREARQGFGIDEKGINDVVTDVDRSIETFVNDAIRDVFPDDDFFGEEYGEESTGAARKWVVDPIDGTMNFANRIPVFCVSIALQVDGISRVGVIYEPNRDELFSATLGGGARMNGESISVATSPKLERSVVATGFPPLKSHNDVDNVRHFSDIARRCRNVRRLGSAAVDLAYVACGRLDGFWEFHLNPWDTAAGYLLVNEAGGQSTNLKGEAYHGYGACVIATNGAIHQELLGALGAVEDA